MGAKEARSAGRSRRNETSVVLVVGDALRHDALLMRDASGTPTALTDRLADWIRFDRCYAAAPWTLPSSTSLFTGTDAFVHEHFSIREPLHVESLVPRFAVDHHLAVMNNSVLTRPAGLDGGFDRYLWVADPFEAFATASTFLAERSDDGASFFLMVHSNFVHDYYMATSRRDYEHYFPERNDYMPIGFRVLAWKGVTKRGAIMRRIYDACVLRFHDEVDTMLRAAPLERTIVVVLADHGEGFEPERARIHHGGRVHDDLVRIPCAVYLPPGVPDVVRERLVDAARSPVGAIDIIPTLLGVLGLAVPAGISGRNLVADPDPDDPDPGGHGDAGGDAPRAPGRRVLRILDRRYLYLASRLRLNTNAKGKNMTRRARARNRMWRSTIARSHVVEGFVEGQHKLIVTRVDAANAGAARAGAPWLARQHNGTPLGAVRGRTWFGLELFDLARDPMERDNLLRGRREIVPTVLDLVARYASGDFTRGLDDLLVGRGGKRTTS